MNAVIYTKKGGQHKENQDVCFIDENEMFYFFSLADGVSGRSESDKGAEISCRTAARLFMREDKLFLKIDKREAIAWLLEEIKYELKECSDELKKDIRDYASTLMFAVIDKDTKKLYIFNLGDGMCIAFFDGNPSNITPESYLDEGCYVTTTSNVTDKIFFDVVEVNMHNLLFMMTDGAWKVFNQNSAIKQKFIKLLSVNNFGGLKRMLDKAVPLDDCSFIAVDLSAIRLKGDL